MISGMNIYFTIVLLCFLILIEDTDSLVDDYRVREIDEPNVCTGKRTCGECLTTDESCHWCSYTSEEFKSDRCDILENLLHKNCPVMSIVNTTSSIEYLENVQPRDSTRDLSVVQLSPQRMKVTLRPHVPVTFPLTFRLAQNYPVDLYFLMDMSFTMGIHLKTLANISDILASSIKSITTDFRLGFGSFVDKTTLPYTDMALEYTTKVDPAYGFKNRLSLTNNVTKFKNEVYEAPMSANLDGPEGGFDAIMQVLACKNEIGWRVNSRKLLLFFTNGAFHYAGDGKLGGIVVPNDGQCHLSHEGLYSESLNQDYPSISQLIQKITDSKVHVVFAVTDPYKELYTKLSEFIEGSSMGILPDAQSVSSTETPDVLRIVQDNYKKIRQSIQLKTEADEQISVTYKTNCINKSTSKTPECSDINVGSSVIFNVTIQIHSCSDLHLQKSKSLIISPVGITEKLIVDLDFVCQCDCEKPELSLLGSSECSGSGTLACGACVCNDGYLGDKCQCSASDYKSFNNEDTCKRPHSSLICEERGRCECGRCVNCTAIPLLGPDKRYSGKYCECNDYNCPTYDDMPCGGAGRGTCLCSTCHCDKGFSGKDCGCATGLEECTDSKGGICNGKGECICGVCECTLDTSYKGKTCEDCPTCHDMCDQRKSCVQCHYQPQTDPCYLNCSHYDIELVDLIEVNGSNWKSCRFRDSVDYCDVDFVFNYDSNHIKVQKTKTCSVSISNTVIIAVVVVVVIFIGVICLIVWKIVVTVHDRREYARFEKEKLNMRWHVGENEIYQKPISTFKNPTYNGNNL